MEQLHSTGKHFWKKFMNVQIKLHLRLTI